MGRTIRYLVGGAAVTVVTVAMIAGMSAAVAVLGQIEIAQAWEATAQPVATVVLAVTMVASAVSLAQSLSAQRKLLTTHRQLDLTPAHVRELRSRMCDAARMLAEERPTLRLAAVYELLAVADDWCRIARRSPRAERILLEHQRCLDLICGYLRANHRLERFVPGTSIEAGSEHDERIVREQMFVGVATHLNVRRHLGPFRIDLSGADLAGMRLQRSYFPGLVARGCVLTDADLSGSDLSGADLTDIVAANTRFTDANLSGARLVRCTATYASFNGADLSGAELTDAVLRGAQLIAATCDRTDLTGTDLRAAKLMRLDLSSAAWHTADLSGADLTGAQPKAVIDHATSAVPERKP